MSYFEKNQSSIKLFKKPETSGYSLRKAQIGAIHSIGSHFSVEENTPALVVMPTGSGKTAVLCLTPYLLKSKRVLIISSSKLVRGQIFEEISTLKTLVDLSVFSETMDKPKCFQVEKNVAQTSDWEKLEGFDFIVGIPGSLTNGIPKGVTPPQDLFDLILVDETHHLPATTWTLIVNAFPNAKKVLFTATPFRRDRKEIKGKLIYSYPLSKAYEDKIFGEIGYFPIDTRGKSKEEKDKLIAKESERVFLEDKANGLDHFIMVRTNLKNHAEKLKTIYAENTNLNLRLVHSSHTYSYIKKTIKKLKNKELDGIICVNMLAEGFDFPNLKIGAIHAHHKSLAVTLQFIGRFARTNAENIGSAKFIAGENDLVLGKKHLLYQDGAIWDELMINLSEVAVQEIQEDQAFNESFEDEPTIPEEDLVTLDLSILKPFSHMKIFRTNEFNVLGVINMYGQKVIFHKYDTGNNISIIITEQSIKPKWLQLNKLEDKKNFLYIAYYEKNTKLLYLHYSGKKSNTVYNEMLECYDVEIEEASLIPKADIHKALYGLKDLSFFNIGLQNRAIHSGESYKIISGSAAHNTVSINDGRMYSNGHIQGVGVNSSGEKVSIGYSSGSKIWGSNYLSIRGYIAFCQQIGTKINSSVKVVTNTGLDNIPIPKHIQSIPDDEMVSYIQWNRDTFRDRPYTIFIISELQVYNGELIDLTIKPQSISDDRKTIFFTIDGKDFSIPMKFIIGEGFLYNIDNDMSLLIHFGEETKHDFLAYLTDFPLEFQLSDLSTISNLDELLVKGNKILFDNNRMIAWNWGDFNIDQTKEFEGAASGKVSIHEGMYNMILSSNPDLIMYDHGTNEIADYVTLDISESLVTVKMFHVKAADNDTTGDRVSYLYEVCGQCTKSLIWTQSRQSFYDKLMQRLENLDSSVQVNDSTNKIKEGNKELLDSILDNSKRISFEIYAVQPGLSRSALSDKLSFLLSSTNEYINTNANNEKLLVWCSN